MLEEQINTPCGKATINSDPDMSELNDFLNKEGLLNSKPADARSNTQKSLDMVYEYYVNNLLSRPSTQVKNIVGNALPLPIRVLETVMAVPISHLQRAIGHDVDKVTIQEAYTEALGIGQGMVDAFRFLDTRFTSMLDQGVSNEDILKSMHMPEKLATQAKIERQQRNIQVENPDAVPWRTGLNRMGAVINVPGATLSAVDVFFKVINYRASVSKQAMRLAMNESHPNAASRTAAFERHLNDAYTGENTNLINKGIADADNKTFTERPPGKVNQFMAGDGHKIPGVRWLIPFRRTMVNVINYGIERSPFAPVTSRTRQALAAGGPEQAEAVARMAAGTLVYIGAQHLFDTSLDGAAPRDAQARDLWEKDGHKEYSISIAGHRVSLDIFGPLTPWLKAHADQVRAVSSIGIVSDDNPASVYDQINSEYLVSLADAMYSDHWMANFSSFMATLDRAQRDQNPQVLLHFADRFAVGMIPTPIQGLTKAMDPEVKDISSPFDRFLARLPELSKRIEPKIDLWGNIMTHDHMIDETIASPITGQDRVAVELRKIGLHIPVPARERRGVTMSPAEYREFMQLSGKGTFGQPPLRDALIDAMTSSLYSSFNTDIGRSMYIQSIINSYRESATAWMTFNSPWGERVQANDALQAYTKGVSR
jgi:hypothetical protein